MSSVSVFKSAKSSIPFGCVDIENVFNSIKTGKFWPLVKQYRETKDSEYKKTIPCYTPSGVFSHRSIDGLVEYTGLLSLDIDKKDNPDIDLPSIMDSLRDNQFIRAFHKSVGGEGYAVYIETDVDSQYHGQAFESIEKSFFERFGIVVDKACKDVSRLRFVSADSKLYYNRDSKVLHIEIKKTYDDIRATGDSEDCYFIRLLNRIIDSGIDITDSYEDWVKVAFGIANSLGEEGRPYFHSISQASQKYRYSEADKLYSSAIRRESQGRGNVKTKRSVYQIAADYGIYNKNE